MFTNYTVVLRSLQAVKTAGFRLQRRNHSPKVGAWIFLPSFSLSWEARPGVPQDLFSSQCKRLKPAR